MDDSGGGDGFLDVRFNLTIADTEGYSMTADIVEPVYSDSKKDKVIVMTLNSSDGFRFDTNSQNSNKTSNFGTGRLVHLITERGVSGDCEIDFRFNWLNGLDLGALVAQDEFGACDAVAPDVCSDVVAA